MEKYNLLVAGGGFTGVAAAISAARKGLKVLLVEKSGCLGGAMSNNLIFPFMPYWTQDPETNETKYLSRGFFEELRLRHMENMWKDHVKHFNSEYMKFLLDEMTDEANVDVLFHSCIFDVQKEGRKIESVTVASKSGKFELEADFYIDATGDGDLFCFAGCDYQLGRDDDGFCQPMTTCFRVGGVDVDLFKEERANLQNLYLEKQKSGEITNPRENILCFFGTGNDVVHFNTTRVIKLDPTNPFELSKAEKIARRQIDEMMRFLKENSKAFEESTVLSVAGEIGVRESRKLKGEYILTADDLISCTMFDDSIALGNYDIDIHNPAGTGTSHRYFEKGEFYSIPYRSLLPKEFDNLLVAGRCASATHEAQASIRIMPICCCMGEAAGVACAVAFDSGKNLHNLDVKQVQSILRENGAAIFTEDVTNQ
ncbi:MAG: FAD-dependent oxidoreductase [Clostridia bacterium]|nr:FAD-dependent oxidoreductase [Clostridia bacterium]